MSTEIEIVTPAIDLLVEMHHDGAVNAIARMSPSRRYGADTNLNCWRRVITSIDPNGTDGYAFVGHALKVGASAHLPVGSLLLAVDSSWAKARWYAGSFIAPIERSASLLRVGEDGLQLVIESRSKAWARQVLGHLMTNQGLLSDAGVAIDKRLPGGRGLGGRSPSAMPRLTPR